MKKELVAYFSATGTTARVAKLLSEAAGADLYEIKPAVPYTRADLNWNNSHSRSSLEMNDPASRPELAGAMPDVSAYEQIYLGFPSGGTLRQGLSAPSWKAASSAARP